jgi:hypothetical protein
LGNQFTLLSQAQPTLVYPLIRKVICPFVFGYQISKITPPPICAFDTTKSLGGGGAQRSFCNVSMQGTKAIEY